MTYTHKLPKLCSATLSNENGNVPHVMISNRKIDISFDETSTGLSERFEVDGWVIKLSGQSRDILFKKRHPWRNAEQSNRPILTK